jgi:hypothetical protein
MWNIEIGGILFSFIDAVDLPKRSGPAIENTARKITDTLLDG